MVAVFCTVAFHRNSSICNDLTCDNLLEKLLKCLVYLAVANQVTTLVLKLTSIRKFVMTFSLGVNKRFQVVRYVFRLLSLLQLGNNVFLAYKKSSVVAPSMLQDVHLMHQI